MEVLIRAFRRLKFYFFGFHIIWLRVPNYAARNRQEKEWAEDRSTLYYATTDKSTQNFEKSLFIQNVFQDTVGFCAAEIIRRTIGYAHVADFSVLTDPSLRTTRQKAALLFAKDCLEQKKPLKSLADFLELLYLHMSAL